MNKELILKPGRERSVLQRRPWIFSGAVARVTGNPESGETVLVKDAEDHVLGWAAFSPHSKILARMWTWNPAEIVDFHSAFELPSRHVPRC
jgi:23S rRNA (cytosine1962-C5)-methyltransferase